MSTETITIEIDAEAARAYKAASGEEQRKLQALLSLWLKDVATAEPTSLMQLMDDIGNRAQARGLTVDELETILDDE